MVVEENIDPHWGELRLQLERLYRLVDEDARLRAMRQHEELMYRLGGVAAKMRHRVLEQACACEGATASGPRYVLERVLNAPAAVLARYAELACDKCDKPWRKP